MPFARFREAHDRLATDFAVGFFIANEGKEESDSTAGRGIAHRFGELRCLLAIVTFQSFLQQFLPIATQQRLDCCDANFVGRSFDGERDEFAVAVLQVELLDELDEPLRAFRIVDDCVERLPLRRIVQVDVFDAREGLSGDQLRS